AAMSSSQPPRPGPDSPAPGPQRSTRTLARYCVVLHRAADISLLFVIGVLRELTRFGEAEAETRMWEAYHRGRALVLVTHLERAELYVEQFADRGLRASIEPA